MPASCAVFATLTSGTSGNIDLTGSAAFGSATSYTCTVSGANGTITTSYRFLVSYTSGSRFVITSTAATGTQGVGWICVGN